MSKFNAPHKVIFMCTGSKCSKRGGKDAYKTACSFIKHSPLRGEVEIIRTECTDRCDYAPVCSVQPGNKWLKEYRTKDVLQILAEMVEERMKANV